MGWLSMYAISKQNRSACRNRLFYSALGHVTETRANPDARCTNSEGQVTPTESGAKRRQYSDSVCMCVRAFLSILLLTTRDSEAHLSWETLITPSSLGMITAVFTTSWKASILLIRTGFRVCGGRGWASAAICQNHLLTSPTPEA